MINAVSIIANHNLKMMLYFLLSKEQIDIVALRISYDMEYFSRHPNDTLKKMLFTIVLNHFNEHDYRHRKGCFKKTTDCRFHYPRTI
jgi:hypothetical protein